MNVQSASIDVPAGCPNHCKFCVSDITKKKCRMLQNVFKGNSIDPFIRSGVEDRLLFLKQKGVDTLILTGSASEPMFNRSFLDFFFEVNNSLGRDRFFNIELQTSGVGLEKLDGEVDPLGYLSISGVKTISLSIASFIDDLNMEIMNTPERYKFKILNLCRRIKEADFNLRLSLNINKIGFSYFNDFKLFFTIAKNLEADQITFRKLYSTNEDVKVNEWIQENSMPDNWWERLNTFIKENGKPLNRLPFGAMKYSIMEISTVVDNDCMSQKSDTEDLKYMILRRNGKLYSKWDDPASLIF